MKVLFLTNGPSPYRVDFFNEVGKKCDLTVLYESDTTTDLRGENWSSKKVVNFKAIFLKSMKLYKTNSVNPEVISYLKMDYDIIVIGGYSTPTGMMAILYLKFKKIPFILNTDGGIINYNDSGLKKWIKSFFISSANYYLSTSENTSNYLKYYGANSDEIFVYPFSSILQKDLLQEPLSNKTKLKIKNDLNIKYSKVILSIGQFIHRKGFDLLLEVALQLPKEYGIFIIGGEPTEEFMKFKKENKLENVHFLRFLEKDELRQYYLMSDVFVLLTREDIWGLVINEAMAYGLPIITTDNCVAGLELVEDYKNGFIVPVNNTELPIKYINLILQDDALRCKMENESLETIKEYTIEKMADSHINIFSKILM